MFFAFHQILDLNNYHFNLYSILPFTVGIIIIALAIIIIKRENFSQASLTFSFIASAVTVWLWTQVGVFSSSVENVAFWWSRAQNVGVVFIPSATFLFNLSITKKLKYYKPYAITSVVISLFFLTFVVFTNKFVEGVYSYPWGFYAKYSPFLTIIFLFYFASLMLFSLKLLIKEFKKAKSTKQRNRYKYLLLTLIVANTGSIDYLPAYGINIFPFGFLSVLLFVFVLFFLIKRYELIDITPAFAAHQIIETMNDILIIFNKNGIIQFVNRSTAEFFGLEHDKIKGMHILQLVDDPDFSKNFNNIIASGSVNDYEVFYSKDSSDKRCLSLSILSIRNGLLQILVLVCIGRDRTEYKRAETELKTAYAVPKTIIEAAPVGIIVYDNNYKVRQINKAALKYTGLKTEKEVLNKHLKIKLLDKSKENIKPTEGIGTTEKIIALSEGNNISVIRTTLPISIKKENLYLDVLVDITERKELEKKLNEYKAYLEKLVQERTKELGAANSQLLGEVNERKKIEEDLRNYIQDLEKFRKITIDRENKLTELKQEANKLALELNETQPF